MFPQITPRVAAPPPSSRFAPQLSSRTAKFKERAAIKRSPFDTLPDEILTMVLEALPFADRVRSSRVCKRFHEILEQPYLWPRLSLSAARRPPENAYELHCILSQDKFRSISEIDARKPRLLWDAGMVDVVTDCCPDLKCLKLSGGLASAAIQSMITGALAPRLEELEMEAVMRGKTSDVSLSTVLQRCSSLRTLRLLNVAVTNGALVGMRQLRSLSLLECIGLSWDGLEVALRSCPHLESISLIPPRGKLESDWATADMPLPNRYDDPVVYKLQFPALRHLSVPVRALGRFARRCPNLESLVVTSGCPDVDDVTLEAIGESFPSVSRLTVCSGSHSDLGVRHLTDSCPNLTSVHLDSPHVTEQSLLHLSRACPSLCDLALRAPIKISRGTLAVLSDLRDLRRLTFEGASFSSASDSVSFPSLACLALVNCDVPPLFLRVLVRTCPRLRTLVCRPRTGPMHLTARHTDMAPILDPVQYPRLQLSNATPCVWSAPPALAFSASDNGRHPCAACRAAPLPVVDFYK